MVVKEDGSDLHIYGVNEKDAGNYSCYQYQTMHSFHLLQVADSDANITKVRIHSIFYQTNIVKNKGSEHAYSRFGQRGSKEKHIQHQM